MGVVYLAEHERLKRKVALKVLAPELADDERFRDRFIRESELAASLDEPNVLPVYDAGEHDGNLFIAMRYVAGTDLRGLIDESPLALEDALTVVDGVARALDAAHSRGLVHRDIKPGNILVVRSDGPRHIEHVYLSDFGLTKRSASRSGVTGTGVFVGTLEYAAPEQFEGTALGPPTDVYSLGCVLFECLVGEPPFRREQDAAVMYAHLHDPPPERIRAATGAAWRGRPGDREGDGQTPRRSLRHGGRTGGRLQGCDDRRSGVTVQERPLEDEGAARRRRCTDCRRGGAHPRRAHPGAGRSQVGRTIIYGRSIGSARGLARQDRS